MSTTLKRTRMALDEATRHTLDKLSQEWGVSKAEDIRRSVTEFDKNDKNEITDDKIKRREKRIAAYKELEKIGLSGKKIKEWLKELKLQREAWKYPWEKHE